MINGSAFNVQAEVNRQASLAKDIAQLQTDISTGVKVHVASDDPAAAAQIGRIRTMQADATAYTTNITTASATTSLIDSNLGSVQTALDRAKELVLTASNGTMNASDRAAAATELKGIVSDIQGYAQQTDASGQPLFTTGTPLAVPISRTQTVAANDSYDEVFGSVTLSDGSSKSITDILNDAVTAITNGDATGMSSAMTNVDSAQTQVTNARADVGIRENQLSSASNQLATYQTDLSDQRSSLEDTDVTAAYTTLSQKMTTLSAAQTVLAELSKNNLFDKLS